MYKSNVIFSDRFDLLRQWGILLENTTQEFIWFQSLVSYKQLCSNSFQFHHYMKCFLTLFVL